MNMKVEKRKGYGSSKLSLKDNLLMAFSTPKLPSQVEKELGIKKLKLKPFLSKNLLIPLNPDARKGRLYILSDKGKKRLKLSGSKKGNNKDWKSTGWIMASPKQRFVILKTVAIDLKKRTSEEIRERASRLNPHLSRISTKCILKELVNKNLIQTEMVERKRYYGITCIGRKVLDTLIFRTTAL